MHEAVAELHTPGGDTGQVTSLYTRFLLKLKARVNLENILRAQLNYIVWLLGNQYILFITLLVQWSLYKWGLYKWGTSISGGILDFLYSFPYKWTSINGEVGNGGPRVFRSYLLHTK